MSAQSIEVGYGGRREGKSDAVRRVEDLVDRWMRTGTAETPPPESQFDDEAAAHARKADYAQQEYGFAIDKERGRRGF